MKNGSALAIITGFAKTEGIEDFQDQLQAKVSPEASYLIESVPLRKASLHPEAIVAEVSAQIDALLEKNEEIVLIGHSYGSLIALSAVCRSMNDFRCRLSRISHLFLIDGPLRSDVEVPPVDGLYQAFSPHYSYRPTLAQQWEAVFTDLDTSKLTALGSLNDTLVPYEAKFFPDLETVQLQDDLDLHERQFDPTLGYNVILPARYKGHSIKKRTTIASDIVSKRLACK